MNGKGEPKLLFPGLAGFYAAVSDLWYPMIRIAIGAILFIHGYAKVENVGIGRVATNFVPNYVLPMPNAMMRPVSSRIGNIRRLRNVS